MFVSINQVSGDHVTSLDPIWRTRFDDLRELTNSGGLVCPGCKQTLRFRVGEQRRPHFAHRVLSDCPLSKQSAEVLEAKAQLYEWLCTKYPGKVELDVDFHLAGWNRAADVVVRVDEGKTFAYWVFERTPRERYPLSVYLARNELAHVLYTLSAQKRSESGEMLELTAAQRDFIQCSRFDDLYDLGHLCFLDTEHRRVLLYRGLDCVHGPNQHDWWELHELDWSACKISPRTGELVAEGEVERKLKPAILEKTWCPTPEMVVAERAEPMETKPEAPRERLESLYDLGKAKAQSDRPVRQRSPVVSKESSHNAPPPNLGTHPLTCKICGEKTEDYSSSQPGKGTCICRKCLPAYIAEQKAAYSRRLRSEP